MKLIVDKMPVKSDECIFASNSTGVWRCKHTGKPCPVNKGESCPHLAPKTSRKAKECANE